MNGAALAVGIPAGDVLIWISLARVMFRRWHLHEVIKSECPNRSKDHPYGYSHGTNCNSCRTDVLWWQARGKTETANAYLLDDELAFHAIWQAFFWWAWIWVYLIVQVIRVNPPKTEKQIEAEKTRELELLRQMETYALSDVDEER